MNDHQSAIDTMRSRQSIRAYESKDISETDYEKITQYITAEEQLIGPFGGNGKIQLVRVTNNVSEKGIKLGTYGFIKNPKAYLVGLCENEKYSLLEFAFVFHKLVLYLTEIGLGTCWMGGTFSRNSFEKEIQMAEDEFIPCITPTGYPHQKQRVFDKALRYVVKADNKKPWEKLFFEMDFSVSLAQEQAGEFEVPIEMVRLGPSASNKQPWRLILSKDRKECHFYIEHTPNYSRGLGYDMQILDIGIAMAQFDLACKELNIGGRWAIGNPNLELPNEQTEYMVSWKLVE
jgi:nitroreductase